MSRARETHEVPLSVVHLRLKERVASKVKSGAGHDTRQRGLPARTRKCLQLKSVLGCYMQTTSAAKGTAQETKIHASYNMSAQRAESTRGDS